MVFVWRTSHVGAPVNEWADVEAGIAAEAALEERVPDMHRPRYASLELMDGGGDLIRGGPREYAAQAVGGVAVGRLKESGGSVQQVEATDMALKTAEAAKARRLWVQSIEGQEAEQLVGNAEQESGLASAAEPAGPVAVRRTSAGAAGGAVVASIVVRTSADSVGWAAGVREAAAEHVVRMATAAVVRAKAVWQARVASAVHGKRVRVEGGGVSLEAGQGRRGPSGGRECGRLFQRGMQVVAQEGDGSCCYHALCFWLRRHGLARFQAEQLRRQLAAWVEANGETRVAGTKAGGLGEIGEGRHDSGVCEGDPGRGMRGQCGVGGVRTVVGDARVGVRCWGGWGGVRARGGVRGTGVSGGRQVNGGSIGADGSRAFPECQSLRRAGTRRQGAPAGAGRDEGGRGDGGVNGGTQVGRAATVQVDDMDA